MSAITSFALALTDHTVEQQGDYCNDTPTAVGTVSWYDVAEPPELVAELTVPPGQKDKLDDLVWSMMFHLALRMGPDVNPRELPSLTEAGTFVVAGEEYPFELEIEADGQPTLRFAEGGTFSGGLPPATPSEPLDVGVALLEPVTAEELRGVELILSVLEDAITHDQLTEFQERRILAMAEVIREARNDANVGKTERWKVIGPIRSALRYTIKDVPKDVLAWWKLTEILTDINWADLAANLPL